MIQDENRFVAGWEGHGFSFNNGRLGKSCLGRVLQPVSDEWKALAINSTKQGLRYAHIRAEGFEVVNTKELSALVHCSVVKRCTIAHKITSTRRQQIDFRVHYQYFTRALSLRKFS